MRILVKEEEPPIKEKRFLKNLLNLLKMRGLSKNKFIRL